MFCFIRNHQIIFKIGYIIFFFTPIGFSYSTSLPTPGIGSLFNFRLSDWWEVVSQNGFICISLMTNDVEHLYLWIVAICMFLKNPFFLWILFNSILFFFSPLSCLWGYYRLFEDINNTFLSPPPLCRLLPQKIFSCLFFTFILEPLHWCLIILFLCS